jgi:inhibitor of KinA
MNSRPLAKLHQFIYYLSEQAVTIQFGNTIDLGLLNEVSGFNELLHENPFPGFRTTVPAYATLTVFFDPLVVAHSAMTGVDGFDKVVNYLGNLHQQKKTTSLKTGETITIPVCYGGAFGPDLEEVAGIHQLSVDEVISLHSKAVYTVYMIGFVPGFAYLGGMTEQLASPRKETPRAAVPAGSVGIAGEQTGVYPLQTPGGWQIIGQTPLRLFDAARPQPSLLKAGDKVVFTPIDLKKFNQLAAG